MSVATHCYHHHLLHTYHIFICFFSLFDCIYLLPLYGE